MKREGAYYGLWTFMIKIGQALAAALVGLALNLAGYVPDAAQKASALFGIRFLVGPVRLSGWTFFQLGDLLYHCPDAARWMSWGSDHQGHR